MRTVIISDTHLTPVLEKKKYEWICQAVSNADRLILNGDFWEGHLCSFDDFLKNGWSSMFGLLKSKGAVYLYGNHDRPDLMDERCRIFCDTQGEDLDFVDRGVKFHVEHGHRIVPAIDVSGLPGGRLLAGVSEAVESLGYRLAGARFFKLYAGVNQKTKRWRWDNLSDDTWLVCGHTHLAQVDRRSCYANSGCVKWGYGSYLVVEDGRLSLIQERY